MEEALTKQKSELRSGITAPFNKSINEVYHFSPQMPFYIENSLVPSALIAVLKGEQGTPGLPAALSAVKDNNNLVGLITSPVERGLLKLEKEEATPTGVGVTSVDQKVPTGKKWTIKTCQFSTVAGVGMTITDISIYVVRPDGSVNIRVAQGSGGSLIINYPQTLTLPEDWILRISATLSGYTSGSLKSTILYQEYDI